MGLRSLVLNKKIGQKRELLNNLDDQFAKLQTRSKEAEIAIDEAKTDEEIELVETEIADIESEQTKIDEQRTVLETEIEELENELEESEDKVPETNHEDEVRSKHTNDNLRNGGQSRMRMGGVFKELSTERRAAILERNEVKDFLGEVRSIGMQKRAVKGAELTVPTIMLDLIRDNLDKYSKLISKIRLKPVKGKSRQNTTGAVPEAIWMEAVGSLNELEIYFNQAEVDGFKVGGFVAIANSTLEDSDENLAAEILDALGQSIGLAVDKAIPYGTGKKMPLGFVTRLAQQIKPELWSDDAPQWTNLSLSNIKKFDGKSLTGAEFFSQLILFLGIARSNYAQGGTFWLMNKKTRMDLMAKSISFNAAGALVASQSGVMPVEGGEIIELDFVPDGDIIGGYGSLYLLAERSGMSLEQSEHVRFLNDQTVFKGTARYDGKPIFGEAFVIININNQDPTLEVPFAPDQVNQSDAYLKALQIGSLELTPKFDPENTVYKVSTSNTSNKLTVATDKDKATLSIDVNGAAVDEGDSPTWNAGDNTVTITVKNGTTTRTYSVVVTKE